MSSDRPEKILKQQVKQKIEKEQLSDDQLDNLLSMQQDLLDDPDTQQKAKYSQKPYLLAALASTCFFVITLLSWSGLNQDDKLSAIANEVAKNHLKQRPMELDTDSMLAVQRFFTELEFSPVSSSYLRDHLASGYPQLLGARYCSIQGVTAAQLRYLDDGKHKSTLYEVGYDPYIFGDIPEIEQQAPIEMQVKGLNVSLWVESGLLMALIEEPRITIE